MEIFGYFASILIGVTLGLLGGGGSILTIPILIYLFQLDPVTATAYSLFVVGTTSITGILSMQRKELINFRVGIILGFPSILTIFATRKWIVPAIPEVLFQIGSLEVTKRLFLLGLFAILMMLASYAMIIGRKEATSPPADFNVLLILSLGVLIGVLTGLVGAGGGFLIIPALVFLAGLPMKTATGTSLFIIGTNSLIGFLGDILNFKIEWSFLLPITALAIAGIFAGTWLAGRIKGNHLRKSFGWFTLVMGIWILIKELFISQ